MHCLSILINEYVQKGDKLPEHTQRTKLFNDTKFANKTWAISIYNGFSPSLPTMRYHMFRQKLEIKPGSVELIEKFLLDVFSKAKPPLECAVIALLYTERLMVRIITHT